MALPDPVQAELERLREDNEDLRIRNKALTDQYATAKRVITAMSIAVEGLGQGLPARAVRAFEEVRTLANSLRG